MGPGVRRDDSQIFYSNPIVVSNFRRVGKAQRAHHSTEVWQLVGTAQMRLCPPLILDSLQPDRGQVLEPVLRLHELLDLWRQRVRIGVMHHPHQHRIVDDQRMRLRQ
jgi:hypothetical protein